MSHPDKIKHPFNCNDTPWNNNPNSIWLSSTISLNRNLDKFKFPGKLPTDKRKQIISLLIRDLLASAELKQPKLFLAEDMPPIDKEFLVEHFLSIQSFHQASAGEAFVLDQSGEFLAVLNLRDHLLLKWIDTREELENTWDHLVKIELELTKAVNFAFSPKFGFLTSDPTECGTGLIVTVFLHLPALIFTRRLDEILKKNKDDGVEQTGLQGDPHELIGDIVAFHNSYTLGVTEENILSSLRTLATKLVVEEKSVRQHFSQESEAEIAEVKDKVSRAYAILLHSYQIEAIESLEALSLVKMGVDLGWIKGTTQIILNRLLFSCRRAHLLCLHGEKISHEELPHKRAEFIHKTLQGLELLI
jgi:protein arginine kinase